MSADKGYRQDFRSYLTGLLLAALLTAMAFALVAWGGIGRGVTLGLVAILALVQAAVHLRFFLHIDLSRQKREDLQLILFSTLLLILMAGGTIWLLENLAGRMMVMPMTFTD